MATKGSSPYDGFDLHEIERQLNGKPKGAEFIAHLYFTNAPGACRFVALGKSGLRVRAASHCNGTMTRFIVTKSSAK